MKKLGKTCAKTKEKMKIVIENLEKTIAHRMKLIENYNQSADTVKAKVARVLEDNVDMLISLKDDMIALEKNSEKELFGD